MATGKRARLNERDYDIFEHLSRYRITTREILHKLFFSDSSMNAATKVTSRLTGHNFLKRFDLYPPKKYFVIGPEAMRLMGLTPKRCRELDPQSLAIEYGTLAFCCAGDEVRQRLTVREIASRDERLLVRGVESSRYYIDHDEGTRRLGYVYVDCGGPPDHVARKCDSAITRRLKSEGFRELMTQDKFVIAIVTALENKKKLIREALNRREWPVPIPFRLEVVPDLAHLVHSLSFP